MSLQRLLVHINNSDLARRRLQLSLRLAKLHKAEVVGFVNRPEIAIPSAIDGYLPASALKSAFEHAESLVEATKAEFTSITAGTKLKCQVLVAHQAIEKALVLNSRLADITIMGDMLASKQEKFADATSPIDFLLHASRPVIFIPSDYEGETLGERILLAWDGGNRASRALSDSLPLLKKAKECQILIMNHPTEISQMELKLEDYLSCHKIKAEIVEIKARGNVAKALIQQARDMNADLIIQGGYAHHRFTETVFGGTTRYMMEKMQLPTFMSH